MKKRVGLASIGTYVPERILTNFDLEKMVDTTDEWIRTRSGISERRIADENTLTSDLAIAAVRNCLTGNDLQPDLLIAHTGTLEQKYPNLSSIVANRLQLAGLPAFDVSAACSGLIYSMAVGTGLMQTGPYHNTLITAAEKMSRFVDYTDRTSCFLFGDGACALLLSSDRPEHEILAFEMGSDASGAELVVMGGKERDFYFRQDGKSVFKFAVTKMVEVVGNLKEKINFDDRRRLFIIPHQANLRIIGAAAEKMGIPEERFICNIQQYGNTSSASIGLALRQAWGEKRFQPGDLVFLISFGAGLSWAGVAIEW